MPLASFQLANGALVIHAPGQLIPVVKNSWLPLNARRSANSGSSVASIWLQVGEMPSTVPSRRPTLGLGSASLWMLPEADSILAGTGGCSGTLNLTKLRADLTVTADASAASDLYSMLTISAALLLGRLGCGLMHAAAVVSPDGFAWLLVGDAHSGKSTTIANFISRGWNYLSDDQVVLRQSDSGIEVWGLPRPFHLDQGWGAGSPNQVRRTVDPATLGPGRLLASALLGGLLFPRVAADRPTDLAVISPADGIAALVRQSPWLVADRTAAPTLVNLLQAACAYRRFRVSLGMDTFQNGELLEDRFHRAVSTPAFLAARRAESASGQATRSAIA